MASEEAIGILTRVIAKSIAKTIAETSASTAELPGAALNASTTAMANVPTRPTGGGQLILACVQHPGTCLVANHLFLTFMILNWFWASDKVVNLLKVIVSLATVSSTFLFAYNQSEGNNVAVWLKVWFFLSVFICVWMQWIPMGPPSLNYRKMLSSCSYCF